MSKKFLEGERARMKKKRFLRNTNTEAAEVEL